MNKFADNIDTRPLQNLLHDESKEKFKNMLSTEVSCENYAKCKAITNKIDMLLQGIEKDTAYSSTFNVKFNHESFKELVNMGDKIIPYLFYLGVQRGFSWTIMLLLNSITNENPIKKEHVGKYYHSVSDWLIWFTNSKYCNSNVYFDLI